MSLQYKVWQLVWKPVKVSGFVVPVYEVGIVINSLLHCPPHVWFFSKRKAQAISDELNRLSFEAQEARTRARQHNVQS